ncbi:SIS domain-containing protein [Rheinheimera sp.]|uniref:SIS domain-containing protein n=1 Tax=Rheinheimera sp. TaxID=1869214 RepID=UPI00307E6E92
MSVDSYLTLPVAALKQAGGYWTAREISQQPQIWRQVTAEHQPRCAALQQFLQPLLATPLLRIILTGAGTSAYIGQALAAHLQQQLQPGQRVEAIATTDLVSNPGLYLDPALPTLLVSYGRSGNSPESVAAVELAEQLVPGCRHLLITCNSQGKLAQFSQQDPERCYLYALPDATHDQSFAMTSSFSSMYLATLLTFAPDNTYLQQLISGAEQLLQHRLAEIKQQAETPCRRMVFLGSGPLQAIAREAALKYLELTSGQILSHYESPLGFRHGPKSLVDAGTQVLVLQSSDAYTSRYDLDLLAELQRDQKALRLDRLSEQQLLGSSSLPDAWLGLLLILWCQALACFKSMQLGISPDNPCPGGQVNRVVQGVTLYPYVKA